MSTKSKQPTVKSISTVWMNYDDDSAIIPLAVYFKRGTATSKILAVTGGFSMTAQLAAEAAQRNPRSARNFFLTGKALVNLQKDELSLRWLERAVTLDPNYREAHYLLARTYQKLGRKADAEREFGKFREMAGKPASRR